MGSLFNQVKCMACGYEGEAQMFPGNCSQCGSAWMEAKYNLSQLPANWKELVSQRPINMWRYEELLPFNETLKRVSMGEGWTPLLRAEGLESESGYREIWIKDERQQPTGSFKDRQAAASISILKQQGIQEIVLSSTGNAAAAYAAFCARANIKLWVFLSSSVPAEKMRELALYGAEVVKITGTYDQVKDIAGDFAQRKGLYYDPGARSIPNKEIMKTLAFEIVEQLGWRAPDWYIQAVSGGLGPLGALKGFEELFELGIIDRVPKIGIIQTEGCSPMVKSWKKGLDEAENVVPDTLITVLTTGKPGMAYKVLKKANDLYGGAMVSVSDGEAFRAMRRIARSEGFSVEPAASVAFAGLEKLQNLEYTSAEETIVINCSGHTFSAEKHALEDRYVINLQMESMGGAHNSTQAELEEALKQLDEQVTSIVIIDDNPSDSRLIRRLLQKYKRYRVFEANNGQDGLDLVRQRQPGMVILDLTIPRMDGFSILDELKSSDRTSHIPVMIISGKDLTPDQQEYLGNNAQSIWQKGRFSGPELVNHVVSTLKDELIVEPAKGLITVVEESPLDDFGEDNRRGILVVDDNVWDARLLRKLLEARGRYRVEVAGSARRALTFIEQSPPDLILLDLILPDMKGEDLLEILNTREETRTIPVIIVSAKEIDGRERINLSMSADSIWSKELLDHNSLMAYVEKILSE